MSLTPYERKWVALFRSLDWEPNWRPSNGTEGRLFQSGNCNHCRAECWSHDGTAEPPEGEDWCPIFNAALLSGYGEPGPAEWETARLPEDHPGGFVQRCTALVPCQHAAPVIRAMESP